MATSEVKWYRRNLAVSEVRQKGIRLPLSWVLIALVLLLAWKLTAQTTATFTPQRAVTPTVTEWAVQVCGAAAVIPGGLLHQCVGSSRITLLTQATALRELEGARKRSPWRYAGLGAEGLAWAATFLSETKTFEIKEAKFRAALPGTAVAVRTISTFTAKQVPDAALPADYLGPYLTIPPSPAAGFPGCGEFVIWARRQEIEPVFTVEVPCQKMSVVTRGGA